MRSDTRQFIVMNLVFFMLGVSLIIPILGKEQEIFAIDEPLAPLGDSPEDNWWIYDEKSAGTIYQAPTVNWSKFWQVFKNHAIWQLEAWHPIQEQWVDANSLLTIYRTYAADDSCKIALEFTTPDNGITTDWRFSLAIDYRVKEYVNRSGNHEYTLTYEAVNETFNVTFNWSDMLQYSGLIFKHGITEIDGKNYFWFRVRRNDIPPNYHVYLDPQYTVFTGAGVSTESNSVRKLVRQSNGTLWCAFSESNDVHVAWSDNLGVTWHDIEVWGAQNNFYPTIAVDSNDVVHLVFSSSKNSAPGWQQLEYSNSTDWTTIVQIRAETKHHQFAALAIDSNDNLHIVYEIGAEGVSVDDQVAYINSTSNGGSWGTQQILTFETDAADDNWRPSIAIDNNDVTHIVWCMEDGVSGRDAIYHVESSDYGDTWTNWLGDLVIASASNEGYSCLAINDNNDLFVVGSDSAADAFYRYNGSTDTSWSNGAATEEIDTNGRYASISVADNGTTYIVFIDYTLNDVQAYHNFSTEWVDDGIILVGTYTNPNLISAQHPTINGAKTNRPATGYALISAGNTGQNITYYASSDLTWDAESAGRSWQSVEIYNGSLFNSADWQSVETYNGSLYNITNFDSIEIYNGSLYNITNFISVEQWNGSLFNITQFNTVASWNGSLFNITMFTSVEQWNGSLFNITQFNTVASWNGSLFNLTVKEWNNIESWNGSLYNYTKLPYTIEDAAVNFGATASTKIIRTPNGTLWIVYKIALNLRKAYSIDDGATWITSSLLSSGTNHDPSICVDSDVVLHIVWSGGDGANRAIRYTNSTDWSHRNLTTTNGGLYTEPHIVVDSNDKLHVVFEKPSCGTSNDDQVAYMNSTDGGNFWSSERILTDEVNADDDQWQPFIAVNTTNALHVVFRCEDFYDSNDQILYMNSTSDHNVWSKWDADNITGFKSVDARHATITINSDDSIYITYYSYLGVSRTYFTENVSNQWIHQIIPSVKTGTPPSLSFDAESVMYLNVHDGSATVGEEGSGEVYIFRNITGDSWEPVEIVNKTKTGTPYYTQLIYSLWPVNKSTGVPCNIPFSGYGFAHNSFTGLYYFDNATWIGYREVSVWNGSLWNATDTITFNVISLVPADVLLNSTGSGAVTYNITTGWTDINATSVFIAHLMNSTEVIDPDCQLNTSYILEEIDWLEDKYGAGSREEGYWFEMFNQSGTGELGWKGQWRVKNETLTTGFVVNSQGFNWYNFTVTIPIENLFGKIMMGNPPMMRAENKSSQTFDVYKDNIVKVIYNMSDTCFWDDMQYNNTNYGFHIYASPSAGTNKPLRVYFANESYVGNPQISPYTELIGQINPGDSYEINPLNSSYYHITFSSDCNGSVGTVNMTENFSFIFETAQANIGGKWNIHFADDIIDHGTHIHNFNVTNCSYLSTDDGTTWTMTNGTIDTWMAYAKLDSTDEIWFKVYAQMNGTETGNGSWSAIGTELIDEGNFAPNSPDVITPNGTAPTDRYYTGDIINITYGWLGDPNHETCWVNITIHDAAHSIVYWLQNRSITDWETHVNNTWWYNWDTTWIQAGGPFHVNITVTDPDGAHSWGEQNGTFYLYRNWSSVESWNGSIYNLTSFAIMDSWNGSVFNLTIFNSIDNWNGSVYNTSKEVDTWNGSIYNLTIGVHTLVPSISEKRTIIYFPVFLVIIAIIAFFIIYKRKKDGEEDAEHNER